MINVNELRIGNLVMAGNMWEVRGGHGPYNQTIRQVCAITLDYDDEYDEYVETVEPGKSNKVKDDLCRNINPIPLTWEWLLKFGFKQHEDGYLFIQVGNQLYVEYDEDVTAVRIAPETWNGSGLFSWNECKYVHQLQNLFFALTGEELKLKES